MHQRISSLPGAAIRLFLAGFLIWQMIAAAPAQAAPPGALNKLSPANNAANQPVQITLSWSAAAGATRYGYCVASINACPNQDSGYVSTGSATSVALNLNPGTLYYWQVRAYNANGEMTPANGPSGWWSFTTGVAPDGFEKAAPADKASGQPIVVQLQWAAASGATSYGYCVAASNACPGAYTPTTSTSAVVTLAPNTTYYWQVRAYNDSPDFTAANGAGGWWSFTTGAVFGKLSPANAAASQPAQPTLRWNAAPGATSYAYCVNATNACQDSGYVAVSGTSAVPGALAPNTTYYWQVRAIYPNGYTPADGVGQWWSFSTAAAVPGVFGKLQPANGAAGQPVDLLLQWQPAAGATRYGYCVATANACPNGDAGFLANSTAATSARVILSPNSTYYWQVRAYNAAGYTVANGVSQWWGFSTAAAPPPDFGKLTPVNGATDQPVQIALRWSASPGTTDYRYCIVQGANGACPNGDAGYIAVQAATSINLTLAPNTTYSWQVRAYNATGWTPANGSGQWWTFTTAGSITSGYNAGQFSVNDVGGANYRVELAVPPGTGGMSPKLAVLYDSRGGNGLLGWGMTLSGLSTISRCPATLAANQLLDAVDFDGNDQLCLDGQLLVVTAGSYGAAGSVYETENRSFSKVVAAGLAGSGPQSFTVFTKSGLKMEYGTTADARYTALGRADIISWGLNKVSDTLGNYYTIQYASAGNGEFYPARILYTGNVAAGLAPYAKVEFVYEGRPDPTLGYIAGVPTRLDRRLQNVRVLFGAADTLLREYRFGYDTSAATNRSRLVSLTECGSDGTCLAPTRFSYSSYASADFNFANAGTFSAHTRGAKDNVGGDFDGNGMTDLASYDAGQAKWHICLATANFSGSDTAFNCGYWAAHTGDVANNVAGDFNGDGLTDLAEYTGSAWQVCLSTGSGFACGNWAAPNGNASRTVAADFDGDGVTDLATYSGSGTAWTVCLSTRGGFNCATWTGHAGGMIDNTLNNVTGDFNGDGRADLAGYDAGQRKWHVCLSTGGNFSCSFQQAHTGGVPNNVAGDFNGDGLTDLAGYTGSGTAWHVCLSTGVGFDCSFQQVHGGGAANNVAGDFNGDGRTDLAGFTGANNLWHVCLSLGRGFRCAMWYGHNGGVPNNVAGDFNGDGRTDLAGFSDATRLWQITLASGAFPDLIQTIANGHGAQIGVGIGPITNRQYYTRGSGAVYPQRDIQAPFYVVYAHTTSDGRGGQHKMTYTYQGLRMNLRGRGLLGFGRIDTFEATSQISTRSYYRQQIFWQGLPYLREQWLQNGTSSTLIHRSTNFYTTLVKPAPNNRTLNTVVIERAVEENFEIDGSRAYSTTTTTTYDEFANPLVVKLIASDGFSQTNTNTYTNDTARWLLSRLTAASVTSKIGAQPAIARGSSFTYDAATGLLTSETTEPGTPALASTVRYERDAFGNIIRSVRSSQGVPDRESKTEYDARGRLSTAEINALGQRTQIVNDDRFGEPIRVTDPNGLVSTRTYDAFGRLTAETSPDGTTATHAYLRCDSTCPPRAVHYVRTQTAGAPTARVYYDLLDREIRRETEGFDGTVIATDQEYGVRGNLARVSDPYFAGQTPKVTTFWYDALDREIQRQRPDGSITTTAYQGLTTKTTNPNGRTYTSVKNSQGWLVRSIDPAGAQIQYTYNALGNPITVADAAGNATQMTYDSQGRRLTLAVPGQGTIRSTYNSAGELIGETSARGETTTYTYDLLGRMIQRNAREGISRWTYDTRPKGIGKLAAVSGPAGFSATYSYDALSRPSQSTTTIDSQSFTIATAYDTHSRPIQLTYPTGMKVNYTYNARGYLAQASDSSGALIWRADAIDPRGQFLGETLGNGLRSAYSYDPNTGQLLTIQTGTTASPASIQNLAYTWDAVGNLTSRADRNQSLTESFAYDSRERMTQAQVAGRAAQTVSYDALGNITARSGVGTYTYGAGGTSPYSVTSISGPLARSYSYDADGNRLAGGGVTATYTSYNKPITIDDGDSQLAFDYAPDYSIFRKRETNAGSTTITLMIGGIYERETKGSLVTHRHYIQAGAKMVAIRITTSAGAAETVWLHGDHLGSPEVVTGQGGVVRERRSYDAWGQQRATNWQPLNALQDSLTDRGFTGHLQLSSVGLVHMNGRVYDPAVGRFLSADPLVQAPQDLQSLNRYSYVRNNPLSLTDPSGYNWFSDRWHAATGFVKDNWKPIVSAVLTIATAIYLPILAGLPATFSTAVIAGTASGFVGSFTGTLLYGGSLSQAIKAGLNGGLIGGVSAGMFSGIGAARDILGGLRPLAHGVAGGVIEMAQGGKFSHGFFSSLVESMISSSINVDKIGNQVERVMTAAVIGGTVSAVGGGSFANGAVTAAFRQMFNEDAHPTKEKWYGMVSTTGSVSWRFLAAEFGQVWVIDPDTALVYNYQFVGGGVGISNGFPVTVTVEVGAIKLNDPDQLTAWGESISAFATAVHGQSGQLIFTGDQMLRGGATGYAAGAGAGISAMVSYTTKGPVTQLDQVPGTIRDKLSTFLH
jgi:RHS repeat-associated protein